MRQGHAPLLSSSVAEQCQGVDRLKLNMVADVGQLFWSP